jgi:dolichyl-phosphate beta-glucosyltransferase
MASTEPSSPLAASPRQGTVVVVPCFDEAARLPVERFEAFSAHWPGRFLFVDDGSRDGTGRILADLAASHPDSMAVLTLPGNFGKATAVRLGVQRAIAEGARYTGFWDADLATPLAAIAELEAHLDRDPELVMVFGSRVQLMGRRIERNELRHYAGRAFATVVSQMLDLAIYDTQCGAKLFRVQLEVEGIFREPFVSRWIFDVEILARFLALRRGAGTGSPPEDAIYEHPLQAWKDVEGSKIRLRDGLRAAVDLWRIWRRYRL